MKLTLLTSLTNIGLWLSTTLLQVQPINDFITKYLIGDVGFLKWLLIAMILDLITGIAKAWKNKEPITSKRLRDTVAKFIQYGAFLIITHVVTHYEIGGTPVSNLAWINKWALEFILLIEVKSVYENIVAINPKYDFWKTFAQKVWEALPKKQ